VTTAQTSPEVPKLLADRSLPKLPGVYRQHQIIGVAIFAVAACLILPRVVTSLSDQSLMNQWTAYSIAAIGFYWIFGLAGRFAFCQTFMMLLGGYISAWVTRELGPQWFLLGLVAAIAATAVFAALIGLATARTGEFYFAIATLAVTEVGLIVFPKLTSLTGADGQTIGISPPQIGGTVLLTGEDVFWLFIGLLTLVLVVAVLLERSPLRRDAIAARDNGPVARTAGVPVVKTQITLFALGSAAGGLSGAMIGHLTGTISTDSFGLSLSIGIFLMLLLGGSDSYWGPVLGAAFYVVIPQVLTSLQAYETIVYGGLLLVVVILLPHGLIGVGRSVMVTGRHLWQRRTAASS